MADALKKKYGAELTMIEGSGGVFEVQVDGKQIWSKHDIGRFPEHSEIFQKIDALGAAK